MSGRLFWLASYPKSGNTWFRAFLRNLDGEGADPASINDLGSTSLAAARSWIDDLIGFDTADLASHEIASVRPAVYRFASDHARGFVCRKIHDACTRVANGEWIISAAATAGALYLVRNPLDVAISYAHHASITLDEAIAALADPDYCIAAGKGGQLKPQVEQRLLSWSGHVTSWVDNPDIAVHVLRYEDMQRVGAPAFAAAATFLRRDATPAAIARALAHSSFDKLKAQEDRETFRERAQRSARFFRKGKIGDWQTTLSGAQIDRIVEAHGTVMQRFNYCDAAGTPIA
ncbi:sulfotransferase domain-containing protein [Sphingomonas baiyangensis]|uniref:Sulfotransferase domain-containing protein n=1 Tax=Sphingomonas baiyangensis TaxID=2572576 RepID=A0A4U1L6G7_9SPHN|nr:sulfotransferase domain-containing protein [Sphingomonas baiyangensis]TKD51870.1 sulfotransferase domain-containing protein [Sphingomonas baiyangensis]